MSPLFAEPSLLPFITTSHLPFLVALVAIVSGGIIAIIKILIRHRERMAMIERGMHPDFEYEDAPPEDAANERQ